MRGEKTSERNNKVTEIMCENKGRRSHRDNESKKDNE